MSFPEKSCRKRRWLAWMVLLLACLAPSVNAIGQNRRGSNPSPEEVRRQFQLLQEKERKREARPYERDHANIRGPLTDFVASMGNCTVRVFCDGQKVALGTVVSKRGEVLTKASELKGKIECRLADGSSLPARVAGVSEQHDLALLQLEGSLIRELKPVLLSMEKTPSVGSFLATVSPAGGVIALGVVSVLPRQLKQRGILGIAFSQREESA